jgi:hypothetical protein
MATATKPFISLTADPADQADPQPSPAERGQLFRPVMRLVAAYVTLSALTLGVIAVLRHHSGLVNSAVWTRAVIVVLSSVLMLRFTRRAAKGAARAFLRLRIVSAVMVVAIAVIVALPGTFPVWMKIEQSVCGLVLIGVVGLVNRRPLRAMFTNR